MKNTSFKRIFAAITSAAIVLSAASALVNAEPELPGDGTASSGYETTVTGEVTTAPEETSPPADGTTVPGNVTTVPEDTAGQTESAPEAVVPEAEDNGIMVLADHIHAGSSENWIALTQETAKDQLKSGGNFYLANNISLDGIDLDFSNLSETSSICLNGHNINTDTGLQWKGTLSIYDCKSSGKIIGNNNCVGVYVNTGSTFNMHGGTITGCTTGIEVNSSGTPFKMYGGTITGCATGFVINDGKSEMTSNNTGKITHCTTGVAINETGSFYMRDGTIANSSTGVLVNTTNNDGFSMYGGKISDSTTGVEVNRGIAILNDDGEITDCATGVQINNSCKFSMDRGTPTISRNTETGVEVNGGEVILQVGSITNNKIGVKVNGSDNGKSTFKMNGGDITYNTEAGVMFNGGIYDITAPSNPGNTIVLNLNNGSITGNAAGIKFDNSTITMSLPNNVTMNQNTTGIVVDNNSTVNMIGGSISGNKKNGVIVDNGGTFNMTSTSLISDNSETGVVVNNNSTFTMNQGAQITNSKTNGTTGVVVNNNSTVTMSSGAIKSHETGIVLNNGSCTVEGVALIDESNSIGVDIKGSIRDASFTVAGTPKIYSTVNIPKGQLIHIDSSLGTNAAIHFTTEEKPNSTNGYKVIVADGNSGFAERFISDDKRYVAENEDNYVVLKQVHGDLTIEVKTPDSTTGEFTFIVTLTDGDKAADVTGVFSGISFNEGVSDPITISANSSKTITLPVGYNYTVTENSHASGFTAKDPTGTSDVIDKDVLKTATFNYVYADDLTIINTVEREPLNEDDFTFAVKLTGADAADFDGKYIIVKKDGTAGILTLENGEGTVTINGSATIRDLPTDIGYTVELKEEGYDTDTYEITSDSSKAGTIASGAEAAFSVKRKTGSLTISNEVEGEPLNEDDFTFTVTLTGASIVGQYGDFNFVNGKAENTVTIKGNGSKELTGIPKGISYKAELKEKDLNSGAFEVISASSKTGKITDEAKFKVKRKTGSLTVSKTVTGEDGDKEKQFTFTVTLTDGNVPVSGTFDGVRFTNGTAAFTLTDGQSKTFTGIPTGITYTVKETDNEGYTVSSTGATGTISKDQTAAAAFTNHKDKVQKPAPDGGNEPAPPEQSEPKFPPLKPTPAPAENTTGDDHTGEDISSEAGAYADTEEINTASAFAGITIIVAIAGIALIMAKKRRFGK